MQPGKLQKKIVHCQSLFLLKVQQVILSASPNAGRTYVQSRERQIRQVPINMSQPSFYNQFLLLNKYKYQAVTNQYQLMLAFKFEQLYTQYKYRGLSNLKQIYFLLVERREMHGDRIYFTDQNLNPDQPVSNQNTNSFFQHHFKAFLSDFNKENVRVYHKQISAMLQHGRLGMTLHLSDLKQAEERLYQKFMLKPLEMLGVMEEAIKAYVIQRKQEFSNYDGVSPWQICVQSDQNPKRLRQIESRLVNSLFVISGIIISCTKPYIKASELKLKCRNCQTGRTIRLAPGQYPSIPQLCLGQGGNQKCPPDPFVALPESQVIDTQSMRIQQNPQQIPTGQIARTYSLLSDRYNVNKCVPGDRVSITGIMMVNDLRSDNLSKGCFYVVGIQKLKDRTHIKYTTQEEQAFKKLSKDPHLYQKIYKSIAPGIYGNEEVKKVIACMLFGGSRKHLPDKTILRGDINVLLMGDPSTAKSQFLKFVEQTASIAVYTSGKGSSAAGLTASINKDPSTGQFQIEGGALVLADGGIVCIDEFDKMKPADRVAIHEAMEQQTISIAKAGITTRLNSRTSVLAAANPIFGRYNDKMQISEQIDLQTTILSRFDCIFVMKDVNTKENNERTAGHILDVHQGKKLGQTEGEIEFGLLKKYISYARSKVMPRLTIQACDKLQSVYINYRQTAKQSKVLTKNAIPITVRQLQAVIRLSQSLAKMKLKTQVTGDEVNEAHQLFNLSTMKTITQKQFLNDYGTGSSAQIDKAQELIKKRLHMGNQISIANLTASINLAEKIVGSAIAIMIRQGELRSIKNGKNVIREQ